MAQYTAGHPTRPARPALQASAVEQAVNDLLQAAWKARLVHVAVELDLPGLVAAGPVPASELAAATGAHPPSLGKLLRLLPVFGVLKRTTTPDGETAFAGPPYSDMLRENVTGVVATDARFQAAPWHWAAWRQLEHSIRTGREAFVEANGRHLWEFVGADPDSQARFDHAMSSVSMRESRDVPACYDFVRYEHVVDVGGGTGSLLTAILESSPGTRGTLLDRPENAELAHQRFAESDLLDRAEVIGGDFHDTVPAGADLYVIKHVLHNWDDGDVVGILKVIGQAMRPDSKILIIDNVIDDEASADALFVDLLMLVLTGGGDCTEQELTDLVGRAGLRVQSTGPAGPGALRFLECVA